MPLHKPVAKMMLPSITMLDDIVDACVREGAGAYRRVRRQLKSRPQGRAAPQTSVIRC